MLQSEKLRTSTAPTNEPKQPSVIVISRYVPQSGEGLVRIYAPWQLVLLASEERRSEIGQRDSEALIKLQSYQESSPSPDLISANLKTCRSFKAVNSIKDDKTQPHWKVRVNINNETTK